MAPEQERKLPNPESIQSEPKKGIESLRDFTEDMTKQMEKANRLSLQDLTRAEQQLSEAQKLLDQAMKLLRPEDVKHSAEALAFQRELQNLRAQISKIKNSVATGASDGALHLERPLSPRLSPEDVRTVINQLAKKKISLTELQKKSGTAALDEIRTFLEQSWTILGEHSESGTDDIYLTRIMAEDLIGKIRAFQSGTNSEEDLQFNFTEYIRSGSEKFNPRIREMFVAAAELNGSPQKKPDQQNMQDVLAGARLDYSKPEDVKKLLSILFTDLTFTDEQVEELQYRLTTSNFHERRRTQDYIQRAASPKGQRILKEISAEGLRIDEYAEKNGPMGILRVINRAWESPASMHHLVQNRAAVIKLADTSYTDPLDLFGKESEWLRGDSGHNAETALEDPHYMAMMNDPRAQDLARRFSAIISKDGKHPNRLIPAKVLEALLRCSDEEIDRLHAITGFLHGNAGTDIDNWSRILGIQECFDKKKLPPETLAILEGKKDVIDYLRGRNIDIDLYTAETKYSDHRVHRSIAIEDLVPLLKMPEITAENLAWSDSLLPHNGLIEMIIRSKEDGRKKAVEMTRNILQNRKIIDEKLSLLRDQKDKVFGRFGAKSERTFSGIYATDLEILIKADIAAALREIHKLPEAKQPVLLPWIFAAYMENGRRTTGKAETHKSPEEILRSILEQAATHDPKKQVEGDQAQTKQERKWDQERAESAEQKNTLLNRFAKTFPAITIAKEPSEYEMEEMKKLLALPKNEEAVQDAIVVLEALAIRDRDVYTFSVLTSHREDLRQPLNTKLLRYFYDEVQEGNESMGVSSALSEAIRYYAHFTPAQRALLEEKNVPLDQIAEATELRRCAREYFRACHLLLKHSTAMHLVERKDIPFNKDIVRIGPALLAMAKSGLDQETIFDELRPNYLQPMQEAYLAGQKDGAFSLKTIKAAEAAGHPHERELFFATLLDRGFQDFLGAGSANGLRLIGMHINLSEFNTEYKKTSEFREKGTFTLHPAYAAFRMYLLDLQHNRVFSKLFSLGINVDSREFEKSGIREFVAWPELQAALADPRVEEFIQKQKILFTKLSPYDLVVIHERVLPFFAKNAQHPLPENFFESQEFATLLKRLKGEGDQPVPAQHRFNFYRFTPSMLANLLQLREQSTNLLTSLDRTEAFAQKEGTQAKLNDVLFFVPGPLEEKLSKTLAERTQREPKLDAFIAAAITGNPPLSGEYEYSSPEEERRMTRPDLKEMPMLDKVRASLLIQAMQQPQFLRRAKVLAIKSWKVEIPLQFQYEKNGAYVLKESKNLRGQTLGENSAMNYETQDFQLAIMGCHTHPTTDREGISTLRNIPSGIRDNESGDLMVNRNAGMQIMISTANPAEFMKAVRQSGRKMDDVLKSPETLPPELIDTLKIDVDLYYHDKKRQKSCLDLGAM